MDRETIQTLSELGVAALAMITVVIIAYIVFNRSKSDTNTIKVFSDLLIGAYKDVQDGVQTHGEQSTTRHEEIVTTLQTIAPILVQLINGNDNVIDSVNKLTEHVGTYTVQTEKTGKQIMDSVTPLEQALQDIRSEIIALRTSVDEHLVASTEFRDEVNDKTGKIENRLLQVEKTATQEVKEINGIPQPTIRDIKLTDEDKQMLRSQLPGKPTQDKTGSA